MTTRFLLVAVVSAIMLCSCGSKELTRARAKDIIETSDLYTGGQKMVKISLDDANVLINSGYLAWQCEFFQCELHITSTGSTRFSAAHGHAGGGTVTSDGLIVELPKPLKPKVVEITGITGDLPSTKIVEYTWQWKSDDQLEKLKSVLPSISEIKHEKVAMQLYDDGWRALR